MSLRRFQPHARSGFRAGLDPSRARRQLRVSLGVVVALAVATLGSVAVLRPASAGEYDGARSRIIDAAVMARSDHGVGLATDQSING